MPERSRFPRRYRTQLGSGGVLEAGNRAHGFPLVRKPFPVYSWEGGCERASFFFFCALTLVC